MPSPYIFVPDTLRAMKRTGITVAVLASAALAVASWRHALPVSLAEMLGVLAGAWGVWLTAEESLWNWPVGIAGSLLFAALFFHAHLYGAMGMQVLYVILGAFGWYWWRRGGRQSGRLLVSHVTRRMAWTLLVVVLAATLCVAQSLRQLHDAAPGADALALALSLAAQFLVTKKLIEHWHVSIAADVVYSALYFSQGMSLLSAMLMMHLGMCFFGLWQWQRTLAHGPEMEPAADPVLV